MFKWQWQIHFSLKLRLFISHNFIIWNTLRNNYAHQFILRIWRSISLRYPWYTDSLYSVPYRT